MIKTVTITNIPDMLRFKMFEKNITQGELAKLIDETDSRVSEILSGKREISMKVAKKLYSELKIPATFLIENS